MERNRRVFFIKKFVWTNLTLQIEKSIGYPKSFLSVDLPSHKSIGSPAETMFSSGEEIM
jgi:hypothetical protein